MVAAAGSRDRGKVITRYPPKLTKPDPPRQENQQVATPSKEARERAEQKFRKKEIESRDASKAMAEYQAGLVAQREKTARLRALREAKEAADAAARAAAPPPAPPAAGKRTSSRKTTAHA